MIEIDTLSAEILQLPPDSQKLVAEFVQFLKFKSAQESEAKPLCLENQNFVGMWCDREATQDSHQWLRNLRHSQWT
jgi:hypothetical protein